MFAEIMDRTRRMALEDESKAIAVYRVKATLLEGAKTSLATQSSDPMSFECEAGPNFGLGCSLEKRGEKLGMVPGEMYLGSIASCVAVAFAVYADIMKVRLDGVTVEVTGETDMRGVLELDPEVDIGFSRVTMKTAVQSAADQEMILALARKVDGKSPILSTARKSAPVEACYIINGKTTSLTL